MKPDRIPRIHPITYNQLVPFSTKILKSFFGKRESLQEDWISTCRSLKNYKNWLKSDERYKVWNHGTPGGKLKHIVIDFCIRTRKTDDKSQNRWIDKWNDTKLRSCSRVERELEEWEKIFVTHASDEDLNDRIYKDLKKFNSKTNSVVKRWAKYLIEQNFFKRWNITGQETHEKCSVTLAISKLQIQSTMKYHLHLDVYYQ